MGTLTWLRWRPVLMLVDEGEDAIPRCAALF